MFYAKAAKRTNTKKKKKTIKSIFLISIVVFKSVYMLV